MSQQPLGPFKLVTVNTAPERAKRLIGRVVEDVKDKYTIIHAANVDSKLLVCPGPTSLLTLGRHRWGGSNSKGSEAGRSGKEFLDLPAKLRRN